MNILRRVPPSRRLQGNGVLLTLAISFCFSLAWVASCVGLAPIVGAFAAGLVLDEAHFKSFHSREELRLAQLLRPVSALLIPVFFVLMGVKVDLRAFAKPELLLYAGALTVAAIVGKQVCALAVFERQINRLAIGVGMISPWRSGINYGRNRRDAYSAKCNRSTRARYRSGHLWRRHSDGDGDDARDTTFAQVVS